MVNNTVLSLYSEMKVRLILVMVVGPKFLYSVRNVTNLIELWLVDVRRSLAALPVPFLRWDLWLAAVRLALAVVPVPFLNRFILSVDAGLAVAVVSVPFLRWDLRLATVRLALTVCPALLHRTLWLGVVIAGSSWFACPILNEISLISWRQVWQ
jgi:hypothetical protein